MEAETPSKTPPPVTNDLREKKQFRVFFIIQVVLLVCFFVVLLDVGEYGWTLFLIIPFSIGISCGYYSQRFRSRSFLKGTALVLGILTVISAALFSMGIEGSICILMAEGLLVLPAFLGTIVGYFVRNMYKTYIIGLVVLLNTSFSYYDAVDTSVIESTAVETITVNASCEKLWHVITHPVAFTAHSNLFFQAGVSYPTTMQLAYNEKGKCFLNCRLNNGFASLEIEKLDSLSRMRFRIPDQVQHMKELTFYDSLDAPHLKGYFDATYGEFMISPLKENQCTLSATTHYRYRITPAFYWRWWSDYLVNTMHRSVLDDIKTLAETK
jgi:hypothetical protein